MNSKAMSAQTIREIYKHSKERISQSLRLFGNPSATDAPKFPLNSEFETLVNLVNSVVGSQRYENENDYKNAIIETGSWVLYALTEDYLKANEKTSPSPLFVIKKGLETLHMLLHRDLRRRILSPTESQCYVDFQRLSALIPSPTKDRLSQDDVDDYINDLIERKTS